MYGDGRARKPDDLLRQKGERLLVKWISAHGGCLGTSRRRRTWQAAKSFGELQASIDPEMSEWGNPAGAVPSPCASGEPTRGTETSKYPEEEKSKEIP
jgi:hypothetical protein